MTPYQIKRAHLRAHPDSKWWSRENMRFSGDCMANFGCRRGTFQGSPVWVLWRKGPIDWMRGPFQAPPTYFDARTLDIIHDIEGIGHTPGWPKGE